MDQYPEVLEKAAKEWLGISDSESTIYGTDSENIIDFSADVKKQEAVVTAFKVCSINIVHW